MKFGVIVCCYNEHRLALLLKRFDFSKVPVTVVVDDGSTDGSPDVCANYPVTLLRQERHIGIGAAIRRGLIYLREQGCEVAILVAGNNKDNPNEIPVLMEALEAGADYVQGSRFLKEGSDKDTPRRRRMITHAVAILWSVRFMRRMTEATNGFRAYRLSLLDDPRIDIHQQWLNRYELEFYLHYKVLSLGYKYVEVPVTKIYPHDGHPTSKIHIFRDFWSLMSPLILLTLRLRK
jgi:dolichol-phosphate mannosyltransferase